MRTLSRSLMRMRILVALIGAVLFRPPLLTAQRSTFTISKGKDVVGSIAVDRSISGSRSSYFITSYSAFSLVIKQVVRTAMAVEYDGGNITSCWSNVRVNNGLRDSSNMTARGGKSMCYVHPAPAFPRSGNSQWTTARMYYEEPVGQASVFVESVLVDCPLVRTGNGTYTLTMPNNNKNHYVYRNGVLQEIHVDRTLIDLVFRRV